MTGLALFVYIRPEHTKKVLESIKRNGFERIYIFQDGLKRETDREQWEAVSELIRNVDFAKTEIHIFQENKGLANSIVEGMNYVFDRHETAIALEDDVVLADGYKYLMESLFSKYKENKKVMSVCGGGFGVVIPKEYPYDIYFSYRMSSIAFGTWKDRWQIFDRDPFVLKKIMKEPRKRKMLEFAGNDVVKMVWASVAGECDTWATYWQLHQIDQMAFHLIPVAGYAKDIGRDGTGTNTTSIICRYDTELDGKPKQEFELPDDTVLWEEIINDTADLFTVSDNRYFVYYNILSQWLHLRQCNIKLEKYFKKNGIDTIYIYGIGKVADLLADEIQNQVNIKAYFVENKQNSTYKSKVLLDFSDVGCLEDGIPIVVIPSHDYRCIMHMFKKTGVKNRYILIEDIINSLDNGEIENES